MKTNKTKKGFTIVELVIVIAIIAILAAVLIPTFANLIKRANVSKDNQLVRNMNTALIADAAINGKHETMQSALDAVADAGFLVDRINKASAKNNEILWDQENDVFCYLNDGNIVYIPNSVETDKQIKAGEEYKLWKIYDSVPENQTYSIYLAGTDVPEEDVTVKVGIDVGNNTGIPAITYNSDSDDQEVVIRTNGGTLNIGSEENVAKGQVFHYGILKDTTIYTEENCFHTYGAIGNMNLKKGKAIAEKNALIYLVKANKEVKIEEKDNGKFYIPAGTTQAEDGTGVPVSVAAQVAISPVEKNVTLTYKDATKVGGNVYEIGNLAALEQYRDLVNTGFDFEDITVKLTADITLKDGWTPIGCGSRKAGYNQGAWIYEGSGYAFKGTFDGNNHIISNLNNKGFVPSEKSLGVDGKDKIYSYGFFGITANGAEIKNLTLNNVDIDSSRYDIYNMDSVSGLIGFCAGSAKITNVSVNGTIKADEAVGGIIGRLYNQDSENVSDQPENRKVAQIDINDCKFSGNLECSGTWTGGIVGTYQNKTINSYQYVCEVTINNCEVQGTIFGEKAGVSGIISTQDTNYGNGSRITLEKNTVKNCTISTNAGTVGAILAYNSSYPTSTGVIVYGAGESANVFSDNVKMIKNSTEIQPVTEHN